MGPPVGTLTLTQLQDECSETLQSYVQLIKEGCAILGNVKEIPVSEYKRKEIFAHRREELAAHTAYTKARTKLWDFLNDSKNHGRH
jgi:hypothetical protein